MFVELHMLQNFAPSCLNRDDTNAPKDCMFGGYQRARISSQCLKRAVRCHSVFEITLNAHSGYRTKRLVEEIVHSLVADGLPEEKASEVVAAVIEEVIGRLDNEGKTKVLVYLGEDEIDRIKSIVADNWEQLSAGKDLKKTAREVAGEFKSGTQAGDIALFGRMVAETTAWNIHAACQVAHAISTNPATMEMDFYTAVDDLQREEEPGAGMMSVVEYNSACFYRYTLIGLPQLKENLNGDDDFVNRTVEAFLRAAVVAIPTGKQNSMAAQNPPSFVMAVARESGMPWSLVNAFLKPVRMSEYDQKSLANKSIEALDSYWGQLASMYGDDGIITRPVCWLGDAEAPHLTDSKVVSVDELVEAVNKAISGREEG